MYYSEIQPVAIAILSSIITGGYVLVFVEIGNRKNRENDRHDQIMGPFMHKLSAYFRYISWCKSKILYPTEIDTYVRHFKDLIESLGKYGSLLNYKGGNLQTGAFMAKELQSIAYNINNLWYWWDKMHPCKLSWEERTEYDKEIIIKELKEINISYLNERLSVDLIAKVSGDFFTDIYQIVEDETFRHEIYQKQFNRQIKFVVGCFFTVMLILCLMLFMRTPVLLLQISTTVVVFMLGICLLILAIDVKKQVFWLNNIRDKQRNIKKKIKKIIRTIKSLHYR